MKKLLSILSMVALLPSVTTSMVSCGIGIGGELPWEGGDGEKPGDETIQIINENSEDLIIAPEEEKDWINYYKAYNAEGQSYAKDWEEQNNADWDENDENEMLMKHWILDELKIHEDWYFIISNFALSKSLLYDKKIDDYFNWDSIANKENLEYLMKLFSSFTMVKSYNLAFNFFYLTEYKSFVLENDDIWKENREEQIKSQKDWQRVSSSLSYYQTEEEKWLMKVIETMLKVDPIFDFNQFILLEYQEEMKINDSKSLQILNKDQYQEITLEYEESEEYEISLDKEKGLIEIKTNVTSELKEINFMIKGVTVDFLKTAMEIKLKIVK